MPYRIQSKYKLTSDLIPTKEFSKEFSDRSTAVVIAIEIAIEGVDDPSEQQVLVIDVTTGAVVWDSLLEDFE